MKRTKELYDLMDQFEKDMRGKTYGVSFDRVSREDQSKVPSNVFYNNGKVNELFHAYILGYHYGKFVSS